jgi:putative ABC transport system permease protein
MRASRGKGTKRLPAPLRAFARLLVPAELRDDVEGDLIERYHARLDRSGRLVAFLVIVGELVRIRPWALRAVVRSNRSNRASDGFFRTVSTDVKLALRGFRRRTGNAILIVGTLLLAVGGTTLLFSVVNGVLLRPLPYPDSHELIRVWQTNDAWLDSPRAQLRAFAVHFPASFPIFRFWEDENRTLEAAGAFSGTRVRFQETDQATLLSAHRVTSGVFQALDVQPLLGRWMLPEEDKIGGDPVAVLSHATWRERFGADSSVVGRTITLDRTQHTIVGVMPAGFEFPGPGQALWMSFPDETRSEGLDSQFLQVVGRLSEGTDLAAARRDIGRLQRQMAEQHPEEQKGRQATLELLLDSVVGEVRTTLLFLFASVGLVLVVACANIANLLFGLGLGKQRELAVRSALGAGRRSLLRTSFVESGLLTAIGGSAGLTLAWLSLPLVLDWVPGDVPRLADVTLDWRVLAFTILVTLAATFVIGLLPALHAMRTDPARDLRVSTGAVGGPRAARIRAGLVVSEVALAFLLLAGAGLLANSYARLVNVDTGFESSGLVRMSLLPDPVVFPDREAHHQLALELRERLRSVPGVMGVSATNQVPLSGSTSSTNFWIQGSNGESEDVNVLINVALDSPRVIPGKRPRSPS